MVKNFKDWKMSSRTHKVVVKHFGGAKTKNIESYIIPTVKQKPNNIILHTGTNDFKTIDTPEEITILSLAMTARRTQTAFVYLVLSQHLSSLMRKLQKVNIILRHECNVRNIYFIDNKYISSRFHFSRSGLHLNYYETKKLQENFLSELAKLD